MIWIRSILSENFSSWGQFTLLCGEIQKCSRKYTAWYSMKYKQVENMLHWFISLKHYLINYINISIYQYNLCSFGLQFTSSFFIWLAIIEIDSYEALTDESHKKDGQDFLTRSSLLIFTVLHINFCYQLTSHILYYLNFSQLCQQISLSFGLSLFLFLFLLINLPMLSEPSSTLDPPEEQVWADWALCPLAFNNLRKQLKHMNLISYK